MEEFNNTPFNEEMSERVDRFLRKEMSDAESSAFINELKTNPELKECYQRQFNLMRGIKFKQMSEIMKAKEAELSRIPPKPIPWWKAIFGSSESPVNGPVQADRSGGTVVLKKYRYAYAVMAIAAAMVCGVFIWDGSVTRNVGNEMYGVIMRGGDEIDTQVEAGNYQKALELIDEELGKTYELSDDPVANAAYSQAMDDLRYRKALVYLKMGKKRAAKEILRALNDDRSKQVLDKLLW